MTDDKSSSPVGEKIYEFLLKSDESSIPPVNIYGEPGVGKTKLAKRLSERAMRENNPIRFTHTLWVFMCIQYTKESLCRSIARQLFLLPPEDEEWEDEDGKNEDNSNVPKNNEDESNVSKNGDDSNVGKNEGDNNVRKNEDDIKVPKEDDVGNIVKKIQEKLKGSGVLLILDDHAVDKKTQRENETKFWSVWEEMLPATLVSIKLKKVFISRLKRDDKDITDENAFEVKASNVEQCKSLLEEKLDPRVKNPDVIKDLGKRFIEKVKVIVPGRVSMLAKALSYFGRDLEPSGVSILEKELEEASEKYNVSRLLCLKHDVLPLGVLKDLWWRGHHFFRDSGSVHYSELITYWILEGYFGSDTMTKLYKKGHGILMDLIDCGVLKVQEGGYVSMDNSLIDIDDLYQYEHVHQTASLGLATLFTSDAECFGRITHRDGMLKTPRTRKQQSSKESGQNLDQQSSKERGQNLDQQSSKERGQNLDQQSSKESGQNLDQQSSKESGQNLSTLLLDGIHFTEQEMLNFLEPEEKLQVLALFNTTIKSLPNSLGKMVGLRVLVLRGCEFLQDTRLSGPSQISNDLDIPNLTVLEISSEISSARSMKNLRSSFFKNMSNLKSLHLSGLQITKLPASLYDLQKLQWLIVKDCPRLKKLDSISKLDNLMVVDLSGNLSLDTVDKNFLRFNKLQILNLSKTRVSTTPLLKNIGQLTHLLCRECKSLDRLRGLTSLTSLQTIDLTDSTDFDEFHDSSLESLKSLRTLNLSGTSIDRLPSKISKPRYLYLQRCLKLKRLSCIESLEKLEVLDLSGSKNLCEIEDKFFDHMTSLRILNLSDTKVERLPSLSKLSNLRELFLSGCKSLTHLPLLESSVKLEILDVSNCSALDKIENKSFGSMTHLQKLDFSETQIKSFPDLPNPCNLRHLLLKGCKNLKDLQLNVLFSNLTELNLSGITSIESADFVKDTTTLQILDLSDTFLKELPNMSKLINLTHLSLARCPFKETELDLSFLSKLEVLDLSQTSINKLPKLGNSAKLQKLLLKGCSMVESFQDVKLYDQKTLDEISGFSHLDYLEFPNIEVNKSSEHRWHICLLSDNDKPPVFLDGVQFLKLLEKDDHWPLELNHLCAIPVKMEGETEDRYLQRHELVFADVYLQTSRFSNDKASKSLQIRGFNHFPNGIENIIRKVDLFFLIDFKREDSPFDTSMFSKLNGCWIERCHEMVTIFHDKEGNDNSDFDISWENLGIVNNRRLQKIYEGKQPFGRFESLKSLYLDTCPSITNFFPSSWLPKNLEALQVKYCDKIVSLFETEVTLPKLETLILWELPELNNIGVSISSLQTLKICECPKLKQIEGSFEIPKGLKTLWISGATTLKNLHSKNDEVVDLENLKLESCPMLEYIISKFSTLANCKTMEIKSCEKLETLPIYDLSMLPTVTLLLEDLPKLKSLEISSQIMPKVEYYECPNLNMKNVN